LGGPQSRSGRYGEVKFFDPTGTRTPAPPGRPARSQSLYRLRYPVKALVHDVKYGPLHSVLETFFDIVYI
jgi:hypothetical protein